MLLFCKINLSPPPAKVFTKRAEITKKKNLSRLERVVVQLKWKGNEREGACAFYLARSQSVHYLFFTVALQGRLYYSHSDEEENGAQGA